jgi:putative addiction module killer protein
MSEQLPAFRSELTVCHLAICNMGDVKAVGESVRELRIDYGPGYRVYFTKIGNQVVLLLCGGDKSSQAVDIKAAKRMAKDL